MGKKKKGGIGQVLYCDSVFIWLFKDLLGGNSMMVMIVVVSLVDINYDEILSMLCYVDFVKCIKNYVVVNEDVNVRMICEFKEELVLFWNKLGGGGGVLGMLVELYLEGMFFEQ